MRIIHDGLYPELQLRNEIVSICKNALKKNEDCRNSIQTKSEWLKYRDKKVGLFENSFPDVLFNRKRILNTRKVSSYKFEGYRIENVVFESLPGWEVNATVYLPEKEGKYPGVVCPTGHSSKTLPNYQRSAQVFARNGYIAVSFDPPGVAGEIRYMNDHFTNGLIGYITGFWSKTHFVADALAALDYLETRPDVDIAAGLSITGVSGGGHTAITCALLDDRVKFYAPVCCVSEPQNLLLHDLYTSCPETLGPGSVADGLLSSETLFLLSPKPCLVAVGKLEKVNNFNNTVNIYGKVKRIYELMGEADNIDLFIDDNSGHAYTVKMANRVVAGMNEHIKKNALPALPLTERDIVYAEPEKLMCHPSNKINMFTVNRDCAAAMESARGFPDGPGRKREFIRTKAVRALGLSDEHDIKAVNAKEEPGKLSWFHRLRKIEISITDDLRIPALFLKRENVSSKVPVLLFADENGKWAGLRQQGFLAKTARFLENDPVENEPAILSVDVSGFGELQPESSYYDLASWNDIDRILTYLSVAADRSIMGRRVRDMLAAIRYLVSRNDIDENRIMIGGRGIGAIVAMHAALIWGNAHKLVCVDMLSHYGSMTEIFPFTCAQSIIIPGILKYYDLPDVMEVAPADETALINLCDAAGKKLDAQKAESLYENAMDKGSKVFCGLSSSDATDCFVKFILENKR